MSKKRNKNKSKDKKKKLNNEITPSKIIPEKEPVGTYFLKLNESINQTKEVLDKKISIKNEVLGYLNENHKLYENIKNSAFEIQKKLFDYPKCNIIEKVKNEKVFFDFENNLFASDEIRHMPECYLGDGGNVHICKENGLYINKEKYSSSKLFLANKKQIDSNLFYITSFEKILDFIVKNEDFDKKYSYFCMLPESIDVFNTKIRRCLNTSKGKIISIPKSIAVSYYIIDKLQYGDRYCVVDLDGLHPIATQLSIGKDEYGNKVILREGFIRNNEIKYTYLSFANEYISIFENKYSILFTENEKNELIENKNILKVFNDKKPVSLFRQEGRIDIIFDEEIYSECHDKYSASNISFKNCSRTYVISTQIGIVSGNGVYKVDNSASFKGLELIRLKILNDEKAIIWKERLPKVSLEVIDESSGIFKNVDLIDDNESQNIRLSIDEEVELPFKGTITFQKGKKDYYLPLEREIYSEDINSAKEAHFEDKAFPLDRDVPVELIVKYNYMSESPIKLYARPKIKIEEFNTLSNTWVDPHEIDIYSGPVYNGHKKEINELSWSNSFSIVNKNIDRFLNGHTNFDDTSWNNNPSGLRYHKDFFNFVVKYKEIRSLFDSENVKENKFKKLYIQYEVKDFLKKYVILLSKSKMTSYNKEDVYRYLSCLSKCASDFIITCWYYDNKNEATNIIYEYLVKEKGDVEILSRLSRCIKDLKDDIYKVFDNLSNQIYAEIINYKSKDSNSKKKYNKLTTYVRTLSGNCWFNKNWIYNFYNSSKGKECIYGIIDFTYDLLKYKNYGTSKMLRDVLEFLVCISRLRELDHNILNPNDVKTKEMLNSLKHSYIEIENKLGKEKLVSRLKTNNSQGSLFGYPNYIYMLIVTLSGDGQVNLVGYHDE